MIPLFRVAMSPKVKDPLNAVLYSGYITQGAKVEEFEHLLKRWLDVRYLNTTNSGTSALQLALHLAGAKHGKKVISTPMTCTATNTSIRSTGADILWSDIEPDTGNIDANCVEDLLKKHKDVKIVMVVHWGGYPCDLTALSYLSQKYGVKIIEDAAHAFGSKFFGRKIGSHSDFVCYSFQAIKHLTTGDGGALVCREEADHARGRLLRWFGIDREAPRKDFRCEEDVVEAGFKYHMNDLNATIGIHNIEDIDLIVDTHKSNGRFFDKELNGIPGVTLLKRHEGRESSYWIYTMKVDNRQKFMQEMEKKGIGTSQVHARNDLHTMFKKYNTGNFPGLDAFTAKQVNIPVGWWVTEENRNYIVDSVKGIMRSL